MHVPSMPRATSEDVTRLLSQLSGGNREALDELLPIVYQELRRQAHFQLRGNRPSPTLNTTALVHEAYFKLVDHHAVEWQDRSHFFAVAVRAMRQVIVDHARRKNAQKRGGGQPDLPLEEGRLRPDTQAKVLVALDEALERLEQIDERQSKVVECRFFGGFTIKETADVIGVSPTTVKRDWRTARAWLYRELKRMRKG